MKKDPLAKVENKVDSIEKRLVGELFLSKDVNDIMVFSQVYISNYLPVLYYAVKYFDGDKIASLMNSSIFIDRLLSTKINQIVRRNVHHDVQNFLDNNSESVKDKDSVAKLINNQTTLNKANISSALLQMFSLSRSTLFSLFCDKKLYLNYGIGWINLLTHYVYNPHLIFLLDDDDLQQAESELKFIKNDLKKKKSKLDAEIRESIQFDTEVEKDQIPIFYIGLKLDWIKAKSLLFYCKYLKTNKKIYLTKALNYSELLIQTIKSDEKEYNKQSFREKLSYPGPSVNFKDIMNNYGSKTCTRLFNYVALFSGGEIEYIINLSTSLNFYFNSNIRLTKDDSILLENEDFLLHHHNKGCLALLDYFESIVPPSESNYFYNWLDVHENMQQLSKTGLSKAFIKNHLKNSAGKEYIIKEFEKAIDKKRFISNALAIVIVTTFNQFAEAKGFVTLPEYSTLTVPLLTDVVITKIYKSGYDKVIEQLIEEASNEEQTLSISEEDPYLAFSKLEKEMESLDSISETMAEYLSLDSIKEIMNLTKDVKNLIISSKSIGEINNELKKLYDSLN